MRRTTRLTRGLLLAAVAASSVGCGDTSERAAGPGSDPGSGEGDVPITARAIAAVAVEYLTDTPVSMEADFINNRMVKGSISTTVRLRSEPDSDGDPLSVRISPRADADPCAPPGDVQCDIRDVDQGRLVLRWELVVQEEDHGYAEVTLLRPDEQAVVRWLGDDITGDPRQQALEVPVETLEEIAQDPRLSLTTSQDVIDAGAALEGWSQ